MKPLAKTLATITITGVLVGGGTMVLSDTTVIQDQLDAKTAELDAKIVENTNLKVEKVLTGKDYVYAQITSSRLPNLSGSLTSTELQQAMIEAYYEKAGAKAGDELLAKLKDGQVNVTKEIEAVARSRGEMLNCSK